MASELSPLLLITRRGCREVENGECITAFAGDGPMLRCVIAPDRRTIIASDKSGRGRLLRPEGLD
jgi:hypothetical protein